MGNPEKQLLPTPIILFIKFYFICLCVCLCVLHTWVHAYHDTCVEVRGINFLFLPCLCVGSNLGTRVVRLGGKPLPTHALPTDPSHWLP